MLTDRFNQDPIEEHFGKQRSRLGGCDNPNLQQYGDSEKKLQVSKDYKIVSMKTGNTSGRKEKPKIDITDTTPLPKRKK